MVIINTSIIKNAEAKTSSANYQIEYSIINGALSRVHAAIYRNDIPENDISETYIGSISYENETISCSLPVNSKATDFFVDFEGFLVLIKSQISDK